MCVCFDAGFHAGRTSVDRLRLMMLSTTCDTMLHDRRPACASLPDLTDPSRTPRQRSSSHHARSPPLSSPSRKQQRHDYRGHARLALLLLFSCLALHVSAYTIHLSDAASSLEESMIEEASDVEAHGLGSAAAREKVLPKDDLLRSALQRLAESGTIVVDQRPPPVPVSRTSWELVDVEDEIRRRMGKRDANASSTASATSTTAALATATESSTLSLPTPFDSGFSNNITDSCSSFMDGFLDDETFKACLPFSLLLQVSPSLPSRVCVTS